MKFIAHNKFWKLFMKILTFFKKTNAQIKRSIKVFANKIIDLKPIHNKRQVVKQNTDELK